MIGRYGAFVVQGAVLNLRNRFAGSVAGYAWHLILPLTQIAIYALVFGSLLGYRLPGAGHDGDAFVIFLCSGLLPWAAFAEAMSRGTASIVDNAGYLRKLPMPIAVFVTQECCSAGLSALLNLAVFVLVASCALGWTMRPAVAYIIPLLVLLMAFALGLALLSSALNVFFRDIQPLLNVFLVVWMWLTPVVYSVTMFEGRRKHVVETIVGLNPVTPFIESFHRCICDGAAPSLNNWLACVAIAGFSILVGAAVSRALGDDVRDAI